MILARTLGVNAPSAHRSRFSGIAANGPLEPYHIGNVIRSLVDNPEILQPQRDLDQSRAAIGWRGSESFLRCQSCIYRYHRRTVYIPCISHCLYMLRPETTTMLVLCAALPRPETTSPIDSVFVSEIVGEIYFDIFASTKLGSGKRAGISVDVSKCSFLLVAKDRDTMIRGLSLAIDGQIAHKDSALSISHGPYSSDNKSDNLMKYFESTRTQRLLAKRGYYVYCEASGGNNKDAGTDYASGSQTSYKVLSTLVNNGKTATVWRVGNRNGNDTAFIPSSARIQILKWRKSYHQWLISKQDPQKEEKRTRWDKEMIESEWLQDQGRTML